MPDPRFSKRLICICEHTGEGAVGLIINTPFPQVTLADILAEIGLPMPAEIMPPVYYGGPVGSELCFFLYSSDYKAEHEIAVSETVSFSSDPEILADIANHKGPRNYAFFLGYAGWAAGQLEKELSLDGWLVVPADDRIIFHTPDGLKWKQAAEIYGIDIDTFEDISGTA